MTAAQEARDKSLVQRLAGQALLWAVPIVVIPLGAWFVTSTMGNDLDHGTRLTTIETTITIGKKSREDFQSQTTSTLRDMQKTLSDMNAELAAVSATIKAKGN